MAKILKPLRLIGAVILILITAGCRDSAPSALILAGNLALIRGQYQQSIIHYLAAEDGLHAGEDVVYYNLANVYYSLGEGEAALQTWKLAEENTQDVEILFRVAFNRGVLYYQRGQYAKAYHSFRRALGFKSSDIDSKINLEDSLSRMRVAAPESVEKNPSEDVGENESRLLNYIRRKEAEAWSAQNTDQNAVDNDW